MFDSTRNALRTDNKNQTNKFNSFHELCYREFLRQSNMSNVFISSPIDISVKRTSHVDRIVSYISKKVKEGRLGSLNWLVACPEEILRIEKRGDVDRKALPIIFFSQGVMVIHRRVIFRLFQKKFSSSLSSTTITWLGEVVEP